MGLLEDLKSAMTSALGPNPQYGAMLDHAAEIVKQHGGLQGVVNEFHTKGMGDLVNSWVGTGHNLPISADQLQQVLGNEKVKAMAAKAGITPDQLSQGLSTILPQVIDKMTPHGRVD